LNEARIAGPLNLDPSQFYSRRFSYIVVQVDLGPARSAKNLPGSAETRFPEARFLPLNRRAPVG